MVKKIVAKTNISYGAKDGEVFDFEPGDEVDASKLGMTKAQLEQLYDAGAIELQETTDAKEKKEEPVVPASDSQENAPPMKSTPTPKK